MKTLFTLLVALSSVATAAPPTKTSTIEVAEVFGSGMVLQRNVPVPVWGLADPGEMVNVTFGDQAGSARADGKGRWRVELDPLAASSQPRPLAVQGNGSPLTFENVLVGETWLVLSHGIGKQYQMEGQVPDPRARIRILGSGKKDSSTTPREAYGGNKDWGPDRYATFDLLTIPFANRICEALDVPVGIVRVEIGELEAAIPVEGFGAVPGLADLAERVETWDPTTRRGKEAYAAWFAAMERWKSDLDAKLADGSSITPGQPPLVPGPALDDPSQPTVLFNQQINPLVPFAFAGVLHVHDDGPDDPLSASDPRHADKMRALIAGLRAVFGRDALPFAFTQRDAPSMYHTHTAGGKEGQDAMNFNAWAGHRDRQRRVLPCEHTGMIVTADIENYPGAVGERFAGWALADVYGKGTAASGPLYRSHQVEGDRVIVAFDHAGSGLLAATYPEFGRPLVPANDGRLRFFAVAGEDRIFHRAEARIEGDKVVVRSEAVKQPVAVRYACHFDPRGMNLYNREGLPASPFNSDDWAFGGFDATVEKLRARSPGELAAMLGYPAMLHSHAASKALAANGEEIAVPLARRMLDSTDPDQRCGALRTLGYVYWMGMIARGSAYYGEEPRQVTPAIARALGMITPCAEDPDPLVRRGAAEALALIGAENEEVFEAVRKLAVDDDPLVRTAAMRLSKYRFKTHAHNGTLAYELLEQRPFGDRTSVALAGTLLNHYRIKGAIDISVAARYFKKIGPGRGSRVVADLGDLLRRVQLPDGRGKALDDPEVMSSLLHLYSIGCRNYFLYGIWHWVTLEEHVPAIRAKIGWLEREIARLQRERPEEWRDLSTRYADAIEGLEEAMAKDTKKPRKK